MCYVNKLKQSDPNVPEATLMKIPSCEILDFRRDVDKVSVLLGCGAVSHRRRIDTSKFSVYGT